jgi:hypothetical protein
VCEGGVRMVGFGFEERWRVRGVRGVVFGSAIFGERGGMNVS